MEEAEYVPSGKAGAFELCTARNPISVMQDVREAMRQAATDIPIVNVRTQTERMEELLFKERLTFEPVWDAGAAGWHASGFMGWRTK
jgi:hypothetical protein